MIFEVIFSNGVFIELIEAEWRIYASVNYTIIGSDNGLSPGRRQAIIQTNAGILLIGTLGTNLDETFIKIEIFSLTNLHLKVSSAKVTAILPRPQCEPEVSILNVVIWSTLVNWNNQRSQRDPRKTGVFL